MNLTNRSSRNGILTLVIVVSVALHVVALLAFGAFKIVESIVREEQVFMAPPIEAIPQLEPEYVVNLEQRNQSSAPPRPNPITVDTPDVAVPALNIDVNVESTSAYGRGSGGIGSGVGGGSIREMAIGNISFFNQKFEGDGDKIMFVIDMSGSMVMEGRGVEGYQIVVDEVVKALKGIEGVGSFNIISFAGETDIFRGSFTPVTKDRIQDAKEWLLDRDPSPYLVKAREAGKKTPDWPEKHKGTRADLALEKAFGKRPKLIIFLSDGDPTDKSDEDIYKIVAKEQDDPKVPINTISYKSKKGREFLKKLAEQNAGEYTAIN